VPDVALDLRFLRYAVIAAEQGSFRKAATLLGLSQASVSRRIDILESRLGFKLFCRTPGGVSLTLVGERFLAEAIKGIDHLDRAIHMAASTSRGERGIVRVGILSSMC
jgi:DNA-binding transcriptional LysR family regulator